MFCGPAHWAGTERRPYGKNLFVEILMAHPETVTARTLRATKSSPQPTASTITAKKGRLVDENRIDRIKKGAEFVVLREACVVDLPKHTMVDVVSKHGYVLSYYAEKKGRLTGPAVFRMRTMPPEDVPSRWSAFCRALRGLGWLWMWVPAMALMMAVGVGKGLHQEMAFALCLISGLFFCFFLLVVGVGACMYGNRGKLETTFTVHPLPPRQDSAPATSSGPLAKDSHALG